MRTTLSLLALVVANLYLAAPADACSMRGPKPHAAVGPRIPANAAGVRIHGHSVSEPAVRIWRIEPNGELVSVYADNVVGDIALVNWKPYERYLILVGHDARTVEVIAPIDELRADFDVGPAWPDVYVVSRSDDCTPTRWLGTKRVVTPDSNQIESNFEWHYFVNGEPFDTPERDGKPALELRTRDVGWGVLRVRAEARLPGTKLAFSTPTRYVLMPPPLGLVVAGNLLSALAMLGFVVMRRRRDRSPHRRRTHHEV